MSPRRCCLSALIRDYEMTERRRCLLLVVSWISLTLILLWRASCIRNLSEPYAEDGSALILGALAAPANLLAPIVDGIFILPRFLATTATQVSLLFSPVILSTLSASIVSMVALYFARLSFSSITSHFYARALLSLLFVGGVGSIEVVGSATSVSYVVALFLVILAAEDVPKTSGWRFLAVLLLSFSTNLSFVAAPLFLLRGITVRDRGLLLCGLITLAPLPVLLVLFEVSKSPHSGSPQQEAIASLLSIVDRTMFYLFAAPVCGGLLHSANTWTRLFAVSAAILLYWTIWLKSAKSARATSAGLVATIIVYIAAHEFGRAYPMGGSMADLRIPADRYAFLLVPCAVMSWCALIFDQGNLNKRREVYALGWLVGIQLVTSAMIQPGSKVDQPIGSWERFATELTSVRRGLTGAQVTDAEVGPVSQGVAWGLIHCDIADDRFVRCRDLRGNRDGIVYEIPTFGAK